MFSKVEVWVVALVAVVMAIGAIGFGMLVQDAHRDSPRFGQLSSVAAMISDVPMTAIKLMQKDDTIVVWNSARFADRPTGWTFSDPGAKALDGYVLLSRYDGTIKRHVIELTDLPSGTVVHRWVPDATKLLANAARTSAYPSYFAWDAEHFREIHPLLLASGDLVVKDHQSPLFRIDACSRPVWMIDSEVFHHSTEADADGNIWVPGLVEPISLKGVRKDFFEDDLVQVSPDGKILFQRSLAQVLLREGLVWQMFTNSMYNVDPMHLNDIQPVLADGPYWKKGDLFLSLRNLSMIALYRPSEDRIVWKKHGPWIAQHDVDILDDHRIAVYDNNAQDRGGPVYFEGPSSIAVYDFATDAVTRPWDKSMAAEDIKTAYAGQFTVLPGGYAMVEDVTNARFFIFAPDGSVAAEYINRAEDGDIYHLGWSRYLDRDIGDKIVSNLKKVDCNA